MATDRIFEKAVVPPPPKDAPRPVPPPRVVVQEGRVVVASVKENPGGEGRDYVRTKGLELRKDAEDLVEKAKGVVNQQKEQLSAALEAGKQAYREEKAKSR